DINSVNKKIVKAILNEVFDSVENLIKKALKKNNKVKYSLSPEYEEIYDQEYEKEYDQEAQEFNLGKLTGLIDSVGLANNVLSNVSSTLKSSIKNQLSGKVSNLSNSKVNSVVVDLLGKSSGSIISSIGDALTSGGDIETIAINAAEKIVDSLEEYIIDAIVSHLDINSVNKKIVKAILTEVFDSVENLIKKALKKNNKVIYSLSPEYEKIYDQEAQEFNLGKLTGLIDSVGLANNVLSNVSSTLKSSIKNQLSGKVSNLSNSKVNSVVVDLLGKSSGSIISSVGDALTNGGDIETIATDVAEKIVDILEEYIIDAIVSHLDINSVNKKIVKAILTEVFDSVENLIKKALKKNNKVKYSLSPEYEEIYDQEYEKEYDQEAQEFNVNKLTSLFSGSNIFDGIKDVINNTSIDDADDLADLVTNAVSYVLKKNLCESLSGDDKKLCNKLSKSIIANTTTIINEIVTTNIEIASGGTVTVACKVLTNSLFDKLSGVVIDVVSDQIGKLAKDSDKVKKISNKVINIIINTVEDLLCTSKTEAIAAALKTELGSKVSDLTNGSVNKIVIDLLGKSSGSIISSVSDVIASGGSIESIASKITNKIVDVLEENIVDAIVSNLYINDYVCNRLVTNAVSYIIKINLCEFLNGVDKKICNKLSKSVMTSSTTIINEIITTNIHIVSGASVTVTCKFLTSSIFDKLNDVIIIRTVNTQVGNVTKDSDKIYFVSVKIEAILAGDSLIKDASELTIYMVKKVNNLTSNISTTRIPKLSDDASKSIDRDISSIQKIIKDEI
ncbi:hypothetical protein PIROE2DRAFT_60356, partial [Piromyces sp. E2]